MISKCRIRYAIRVLLVVIILPFSSFASAEWQADPDDSRQVKAQAAIDKIKENAPRSAPFFEQAYGFAILPSVTRVAVGFSGGYGRGLVVEGDNLIGTTGFWQFGSGIQAGVNNFSMIVFFKDKEALEYFRKREMQFAGQAGVALATVGAMGTPAYNGGVAIIAVTRLGLMFEFSYSGIKFTYKDLAAN